MSSWIAAATAYSTHGVQMIPFFIFYSMFGFQRIGDLVWAAGDMRSRGFLLGGTAGRTTLNGEGLQHEDGHSHLFASAIPNCVSVRPDLRLRGRGDHAGRPAPHARTSRKTSYYYLTVMNENYRHPAMPEGAEEGIIEGCTGCATARRQEGAPRVQLLGSGTILREVDRGGRAAARGLRRRRRRLERDRASRCCAATASTSSAGTCCIPSREAARAATSRSRSTDTTARSSRRPTT